MAILKTPTQLKVFEAKPPEYGFSAIWVFEARWAHPVWYQYVMMIMDLTTPLKVGPPALYLVNATHEMHIWALDPSNPFTGEISEQNSPTKHLLHPMNHGYQFIAPSNEAAQERVQHYMNHIEKQELSPDTDYRSVWNNLFADGASLEKGNTING